MDRPSEPPSMWTNPAATPLQPGETLIVYHPHSKFPMHITPTTDLHSQSEDTTRCDTETQKASCAPFPTRADFNQAAIFINNNCSDKFINTQLKFLRDNGMCLKVKNACQMHKLLVCGTEDDSIGNLKVCFIQFTVRDRLPTEFLVSWGRHKSFICPR